MANIKCIDVSCWQGNIDWKKVRASGIEYAILRAGFGREASQVDSKFEQNYKNAKAAGLKVGAYWYSYAEDIADAKREAEACLEVLKGKFFDLPVFYDMEESFQTKFGKSTLTKMAKEFMRTACKGGFKVGIYANLNWFSNYLDYKSLYGRCYIWLAQYHTQAQLLCDMWQYSSSGIVNGVSGSVDMNIIYNDELLGEKKMNTTTVRTELKKGDKGLDVLSLKYMLQVAADVGVVDFEMTKGNATFGSGTEKAVKAVQKTLGLNQTGTADASFVNKLYAKIKGSYPMVGDINTDGKVNIKDATALQKKIAGIED